jgi:hypothetical protein
MNSQSIWDDWGSPESELPLKSSGYNSVNMAHYFQQCLAKATWYRGFGIVNTQALSGSFAKWKKTGLTSDTLLDMIHSYMDTAKLRGSAPGWKDFIYQRDKLLEYVTKPAPSIDMVEEDDYADTYDEDQAMRDYLERRNK